MELVALAVAVVAVVIGLRFARRPHTVWAVADGRARLVRGTPSRRLSRRVEEIAALAPDEAGKVLVKGHGAKRSVEVKGLGDGTAQRLRNVFMDPRA